MWARILFRIRRTGVDLGAWVGSWRVSIALMVVAALYYALLAIWAGASPPQVVRNIASLSPFWLLYGALMVNLAVGLWRRLPVLRRDIGRAPRWADRQPDWSVAAPADIGPEEAPALLRRLGYRPLKARDGTVGGVRRRLGALGTYLFHGAFFLVAGAFLLTLAARQEARVWVAAGERFEGAPEQFLSGSPPRLLAAGVPATPFTVERIDPEFWRDRLLFTTLEARLELPEGGTATTRINRPVAFGPATFVRLAGFGYAPRYELAGRSGGVLDSAFVKLNVFPPGRRDSIVLPDLPHRLRVEVLPDMVREPGVAPYTRTLDLVNPGILLRVTRGRLDLGGATLALGEAYEFEGLTVRFPEIRFWGEFSVVRDPGAPLLLLAYAIGLCGLLLRLRGSREEAEWRAGGDGSGPRIVGWQGSPPSPEGLAARRPARGGSS